jgi:hypothetical protein
MKLKHDWVGLTVIVVVRQHDIILTLDASGL